MKWESGVAEWRQGGQKDRENGGYHGGVNQSNQMWRSKRARRKYKKSGKEEGDESSEGEGCFSAPSENDRAGTWVRNHVA